jgi:hypothetical protein
METELISETPFVFDKENPKPKKPRRKRRSRLEIVTEQYKIEQGLAGAKVYKTRVRAAANPLRDLQDTMVPDENGGVTTLTLPIQSMTRKQYDVDMMRQARLTGFRRYLETIDIEELKYALAKDDSEKALDYLCALMDPENAHLDPAAIAMRQKIPLSDIMAIWRNDRLTATMGHLYAGAPAVAARTVESALGTSICCPRCDGAGEVRVERRKGPYWLTCPNCQGQGSIRKAGDPKARETILKATGVIKGATGTSITINTGSSAVESVIDELERLPAPITVTAEPS